MNLKFCKKVLSFFHFPHIKNEIKQPRGKVKITFWMFLVFICASPCPFPCQDFPNYSFVGIENLWSHGLTTIRKKNQIWRQSNGGSKTFQHLLSWKFKGFIMLGYPSQFMPLPLLPHTHTSKLQIIKVENVVNSWKMFVLPFLKVLPS
jgi:hypothetical protein